MTTCTRTAQSLSEALGPNLVTDPGFDAVTEGSEKVVLENDRTFVGAGNWVALATETVTINYNSGDGGHDSTLRIEADSTASEAANLPTGNSGGVVDGNLYVVTLDYKDVNSTGIPAAGTARFRVLIVGMDLDFDLPVSAIWVEGHKIYFNSIVTDDIRILIYTNRSSGGHADNELLVDNFSIKPVTFTNWTEGTGWAPQATAGSLTGKAVHATGTASNLGVAAAPGINVNSVYRLIFTISGRTDGDILPRLGSFTGTVVAANGTDVQSITASDDDLYFSAGSTFDGAVDDVSCQEITRRGIPD